MGSGPAKPPASIVVRGRDRVQVALQLYPNVATFARDVARRAEAISRDGGTDDEIAAALEAALRPWYPRIEIRRRDAFAAFTEVDTLWYVFRDGRVKPHNDQHDRVNAVLSDARMTSEASSGALERAQETYDAARVPRRKPARDRAAS